MFLQANIGGYAGRNASVLAYLETQSHTLQILATGAMRDERYTDEDGNSAGLISNQPLDDLDCVFSEQEFSQAFKDFRYYANSGRLVYESGTERTTPPLQVEKITESGTNLAIYGEISNEQLAVIALCYFAKRCEDAEIALTMNEDGWNNIFTI